MTSRIVNHAEKDEQNYLEEIKTKLQEAINATDAAVSKYAKDAQESRDYLWEHKTGMDHVEKVAVRQSINQIAITGENTIEKKKRLARLLNTPYFGRLDFSESGSSEINPVYIGIHAFLDTNENINLIHDWRAPVSGMFYDYELGEAQYNAPSGKVKGKILLKRQYRIRNGKMEFMLESALNIHDDVLQKELSTNSSEKMKNIVATIQRDQNAIIRNEDSGVLIIQGVAGSGKTSIALHRIAFLLYRFKQTIRSQDILIISPNKVFADYISNVLPELGEEKIPETSMEELANELLNNKVRYQTFFGQVSKLIANGDDGLRERIRFKSTFEFVSRINEFMVYFENECFVPEHLIVKRYPVPANYVKEKFQSYHRLPLMKRISQMVRDIVSDLNFYNGYEVTAKERGQIRKELEKMFTTLNLRKLYKAFYEWLGQPQMLKPAKGSVYEYSDLFPLIYLKIKLEGDNVYENVKHLVIDEMQDYTPIQYTILARLFPCNKTILGDSYQAVNPYGFTNMEGISRVFPNAQTVKMLKSYRSTFEITRFVQTIRNNPEIETIERHGQEPSIRKFKTRNDEIAGIKRLIGEFAHTSYQSLGIICKTQQQADMLYEYLKESHPQIYVLNDQSVSFANGVVISAAYMAKGLEFDQVIVPFCSSDNYLTETDRQMLYVGATRAMHRLDFTCTKIVAELLQTQ